MKEDIPLCGRRIYVPLKYEGVFLPSEILSQEYATKHYISLHHKVSRRYYSGPSELTQNSEVIVAQQSSAVGQKALDLIRNAFSLYNVIQNFPKRRFRAALFRCE